MVAMTQTAKTPITKLIVFCGAKEGKSPVYRQDAARLATLVAEQTPIREIYYGGGFMGLMGIFAAAAARAGMKLNGVCIPAFGTTEPPADIKEKYSEVFAQDLPRRKGKMIGEGEAAIVLPGGIGTLDELWEIVAAQDVKFASDPDAVMQPVLLLNTNGYYDGLITQVRHAVEEGFIDPARARFIAPVSTPEEAVELLNKINGEGRWHIRDVNLPSSAPAQSPFFVPAVAPPFSPPAGPAPGPL